MSKKSSGMGVWTPKNLSHCDQQVLQALTGCDYRGGMPYWGKETKGKKGSTEKGKGTPYASCPIPAKNLVEFQRLWNANLQGCRYFQNQNNQLVTNPSNLQGFDDKFAKIMELKGEIETRLKGANPKFSKIYKNALQYVNHLQTNQHYMRYEFKNPSIPIYYKWFQIQEMNRLISQLEQLRNFIK